jgi:probable phosphoglycerate mutase
MKLYVTRHGQSQWNVLNKVSGRTDVPLTEIGEQQAFETAQKLKDKNIRTILVSPLIRAQKTAAIIGDAICVNANDRITDERLVEQDYGEYEGVPRDNQDFLAAKRMFAFRYPKGESMLDLAGRIYPLLNELPKRFPEGNVLIVSHSSVMRIIHTYFHDLTNDAFFYFGTDNCEVREYDVK